MFQLTDLPEGEKNLILEQLDSRERAGLEEKLELQDYQEAVDSAEVSHHRYTAALSNILQIFKFKVYLSQWSTVDQTAVKNVKLSCTKPSLALTVQSVSVQLLHRAALQLPFYPQSLCSVTLTQIDIY